MDAVELSRRQYGRRHVAVGSALQLAQRLGELRVGARCVEDPATRGTGRGGEGRLSRRVLPVPRRRLGRVRGGGEVRGQLLGAFLLEPRERRAEQAERLARPRRALQRCVLTLQEENDENASKLLDRGLKRMDL